MQIGQSDPEVVLLYYERVGLFKAKANTIKTKKKMRVMKALININASYPHFFLIQPYKIILCF